jgi:hypothetical protein
LNNLLQNRLLHVICAAACALVVFVLLGGSPQPLVFSRWGVGGAQGLPMPPGRAGPIANGERSATITGVARAVATPAVPGMAAFEQYAASSTLVDSAADGDIQLFRRALPGGSIAFVMVELNGRTHLEVITADGATLTSDATGDTAWTDGGKHLATVEQMARARYAVRQDRTLLGAMAFGFHGARTADEGTVVINGVVQRVNPGRSALCIFPDGSAGIGVLNAEQASRCEQAAGAGPIVMQAGRIANPAVAEPTADFLPLNPLDEDFTQLDWRHKVYAGGYPKTFIGLGRTSDGHDYLVLLTSYGISGVQAVTQLRDMGCTEAIGGDDDTSTQLVWNEKLVGPGAGRPVPTAIGIYAVGE